MRKQVLWAFVFAVWLAALVGAQTPFVTDDAEVTDLKHLHFEAVTEYDFLQSSLYPNLRQFSGLFRISYGIHKRLEVGLDAPLLSVFNAAGTTPKSAFGVSDVSLHVKARLREEKDNSRMPAIAVAFYARFPSGDAARSLGSGARNYWLYGVGQRSLTDKTKLRVNLGTLFAGNTVFGALGVSKFTGRLFTGGVSIVKQYNDKWRLGGEITAVMSSSFQLSKGQLQGMFGGGYNVKKNVSLDFGVIAGRFPASPRVGFVGGITIDR
jgi:hypothetical protein